MPTMRERVDTLIAAYKWEQERLDAWANEAKQSIRVNAEYAANPMIVRFAGTWYAYIREVKKSNDSIIQALNAAQGKAPDRDHPDPVLDGIRALNRVEHRKGTIASISNAANAHRGQSPYFESLDAVIDLENGVRDYIEDFLLHDPVVGTDGA
jgi:hypothetical protein